MRHQIIKAHLRLRILSCFPDRGFRFPRSLSYLTGVFVAVSDSHHLLHCLPNNCGLRKRICYSSIAKSHPRASDGNFAVAHSRSETSKMRNHLRKMQPPGITFPTVDVIGTCTVASLVGTSRACCAHRSDAIQFVTLDTPVVVGNQKYCWLYSDSTAAMARVRCCPTQPG